MLDLRRSHGSVSRQGKRAHKKGLTKKINHIKKGRENDISEADTRVIVRSVLTELLGWDQFDNITAEYMIRGTYADLALKDNGHVLAIIEIKKLSLKLNENHLRQARDYAVNEGVSWVILTNGDAWRVYKIEFGKDNVPEVIPVISISLSDPDTKPAVKAELLYLLSKEATKKNELQAYYDRTSALSGENLACSLLAEGVLNRIRLDIKTETGHRFENTEIAAALIDNVIKEESKSGKLVTAMRKVERSGK